MSIMFWLILACGLFAIVISAIMLMKPIKILSMFLKFMEMFWLARGIVSLRWGMIDHRDQRMALAAGAGAIFTGLRMEVRKILHFAVETSAQTAPITQI